MENTINFQNSIAPNHTGKTVDKLPSECCYGCGACQNICPSHAIEMKDTLNEGFLYPVINQERCINCGLCAKVCPALNRYNGTMEHPKAYAVKNQLEISSKSSSAGIFYTLAKYVFAQGGYICGAVYDDQFNVFHVLTNDWNVVLRMRKSKYVQSNLRNVYTEILKKLEGGNQVLFTGTPCQVAGLYTFLGREYDSLLTMDVICHGVASPGIWRKYLDENWTVEKLENIDFRYKPVIDKGMNVHIGFLYKNGNRYFEYKRDNLFYAPFLSNMTLRSSCENCQYAIAPRAADFSVGDWWGGQVVRPDLIDEDQMSILLSSSVKSCKVLESIKGDFKFFLEISPEQALAKNRSKIMQKSSPMRNNFFEFIKNGNSFQEAVRKSMFPQYDVIIFGSTLNPNFGAIMTYYALYKVVEKAGYNVALANKPREIGLSNHSTIFFEKYTNLAPAEQYYIRYNWMADIFLVGSDQLWNYMLFKNMGFYLNFANSDKKKISYATSFGYHYLTMLEKAQNVYPVVNSLMKRFDAISVREDEGKTICAREHSVDATWVLDPVFLLQENDYNLISQNAGHKIRYSYVVSYCLSGNSKAKDFYSLLYYISDFLGLPTINMLSGRSDISDEQRKNINGYICEDLSMEEWLYNIQNSKFVVTDSFHGTCFSIIFQKNFIVFQNGRGLSRLTSLLNLLGLEDRLIGSFDEIIGKENILNREIDYDKVNRILNIKRAESYIWLMNSLKAPKCVSEHLYLDRKDMCLNEITFGEITRLEDYLEKLGNTAENYVLTACTHGIDFNREHIRQVIQHCMDYLHISEAEYQKSAKINDNLLADDSVLAKGNGGENCRTLRINLKESELKDFRQNPHSVYFLSFDWHVEPDENVSEGSFRMQLAAAPWDDLTEDIKVSMHTKSGHYENIYMSSEGIAKFESGIIQVRTDGLICSVKIENLKLERGNRPTAKYSSQGALNGFALICDVASTHFDLSVTSMGKLQYQIGNTRLLLEYTNQGYRDCSPVSEFYIDAGERDIYPMQKEGLYLMLYAKKSQRLIDFLRVEDNKYGSLIHM